MWSPDGRLILGASGYPPRHFVYDVEAGEILDHEQPLAHPEVDGGWLPDSERVVYWSDRERGILVWNVRTGEIEPVPGVARVPGYTFVSPDGRTLYVNERNVDGDIWMLTLAN